MLSPTHATLLLSKLIPKANSSSSKKSKGRSGDSDLSFTERFDFEWMISRYLSKIVSPLLGDDDRVVARDLDDLEVQSPEIVFRGSFLDSSTLQALISEFFNDQLA